MAIKNNETYRETAILSDSQVFRIKQLRNDLREYFHKSVLGPVSQTDIYYTLLDKRNFVEVRLSQIEMVNH